MGKIFSVFSVLVFAVFLPIEHAHSAACCAGSSAVPSLISGDERASLSATISRGSVVADVPGDGWAVFRSDLRDEDTYTFKLDGAYVFSEFWQAGVSLPIVSRSVARGTLAESAAGLGDAQLDVAYEFLPEWNYSSWRPKGFVFVTQTMPLGKSIYESTSDLQSDVFGQGFWKTGAGVFLVKRWSYWDVFGLAHLAYSYPKTTDEGRLRIYPGWTALFAFGAGVSPGAGRVRLGARVQPMVQSAIVSELDGYVAEGITRKVWDAGLDLSLMVGDDYSMNLAYLDQTLFGPASNTTLSRSFAFSLTRRIER